MPVNQRSIEVSFTTCCCTGARGWNYLRLTLNTGCYVAFYVLSCLCIWLTRIQPIFPPKAVAASTISFISAMNERLMNWRISRNVVRGSGSIRTKRMHLNVPMDIRVLDTGGGMKKDSDSEPTSSDISSEPFAIFMDGLLQPKAWTTDLPSLGIKGYHFGYAAQYEPSGNPSRKSRGKSGYCQQRLYEPQSASWLSFQCH